MKRQLTIFYCWQSDQLECTNYIYYALKKCIYNINNNIISDATNNEVSEDERKKLDTYFNGKYYENSRIKLIDSDVGGSANNTIAENIYLNIQNSDIFVCDLTTVTKLNRNKNSDKDEKLLPNSNVMFELGIATTSIGWGNTLMLTKDKCKFSQLPFDIASYKIQYLNGDGMCLLSKLLDEKIQLHQFHFLEFKKEQESRIINSYPELIIGEWHRMDNESGYGYRFTYDGNDVRYKRIHKSNPGSTIFDSGTIVLRENNNCEYIRFSYYPMIEDKNIIHMTTKHLILSGKNNDNIEIYNKHFNISKKIN